jgi:hypothetical protein
MSTCDLSIGVTAKCSLTSREPGSVTYSLDEKLIYAGFMLPDFTSVDVNREIVNYFSYFTKKHCRK